MTNHLLFLPWEPHEQYERGNKNMTLKDKLPRSVGAQYATGEECRNSSRRNEEAEPKKKQCQAVDVSCGKRKLWSCKEQYFIGTWNVRSMNQGKLKVMKQEMTKVNTDMLGISDIKWTETGEFNSDDHYIYYPRHEIVWTWKKQKILRRDGKNTQKNWTKKIFMTY